MKVAQVPAEYLKNSDWKRRLKFDCGILKMVGPKKQDFGPKINILKGNHCTYFENTGSASSSKIGHDFRK